MRRGFEALTAPPWSTLLSSIDGAVLGIRPGPEFPSAASLFAVLTLPESERDATIGAAVSELLRAALRTRASRGEILRKSIVHEGRSVEIRYLEPAPDLRVGWFPLGDLTYVGVGPEDLLAKLEGSGQTVAAALPSKSGGVRPATILRALPRPPRGRELRLVFSNLEQIELKTYESDRGLTVDVRVPRWSAGLRAFLDASLRTPPQRARR